LAIGCTKRRRGERDERASSFFLTESRYCHRHLTRTSAASNRRNLKPFFFCSPSNISQNRLVEKQISILSQMQGVPDGVTNLDRAWGGVRGKRKLRLNISFDNSILAGLFDTIKRNPHSIWRCAPHQFRRQQDRY
jgi:hypothetical protein